MLNIDVLKLWRCQLQSVWFFAPRTCFLPTRTSSRNVAICPVSCTPHSSLLTSHLAGPVSGLEALMLPDVATESISGLTFGWLSPACSQLTWASSEIQCSESLRTSRRDHSPLGHGSPCWPPHRQRFVDGRWCSHQWNRQQVQCTTGTRWQPRKEHGMLHMILTASG